LNFERHYTSSDGLKLFYRVFEPAIASALPVLCLPGLTRHSGDFAAVAARLCESGRRVVCPDLRGRGRSEHAADWRTYDPSFYFDDLRALLAIERLHRFVAIGTSMGGLLGMAMGAAMPASIAGLIVNDVGPDIAADGQARILDYISVDRPQTDWPTAALHLRKLLPNLSVADEAGWIRVAKNTYREGPDGLLTSTGTWTFTRRFAVASIPISISGRSGNRWRTCLSSPSAGALPTCSRPRLSPA